jgi:hypothetical protein
MRRGGVRRRMDRMSTFRDHDLPEGLEPAPSADPHADNPNPDADGDASGDDEHPVCKNRSC